MLHLHTWFGEAGACLQTYVYTHYASRPRMHSKLHAAGEIDCSARGSTAHLARGVQQCRDMGRVLIRNGVACAVSSRQGHTCESDTAVAHGLCGTVPKRKGQAGTGGEMRAPMIKQLGSVVERLWSGPGP